MDNQTRLETTVKKYLKNHPNQYNKTWTCRVRGHVNNQPVSIYFNCFDCDVISALDPDNMEEIFKLSGANRVSHLTGYTKIGFVDLRIITKSCPDIF